MSDGKNDMEGDFLWGAAAIAAFLNTISDQPIPRHKVYNMLEAGQLPAGRLGGKVIGSKRAIRGCLVRIAAGGGGSA